MSLSPRSIGSSVGRRITYANVASTLALFLALSTGTAYAANTIFSTDIVNGEVKTPDLASSAVTTGKIGNGHVRVADLGTDAVSTDKVLDGTLTAADLGFDAVTGDKVQDGTLSGADVQNESLTQADLGTDSVGASEVADNSIDAGEVADGSLFAADLGAGSVGTSEVIADSLGAGDLAPGSVGTSEVATNSLTTADILGADVNGSVNLSGVANGRCVQVTLSVGGAQAGQVAVVNVKAPLQNGILFYAQRVPADGQVMANICNFTGGAMTPISNLPVRIITWG